MSSWGKLTLWLVSSDADASNAATPSVLNTTQALEVKQRLVTLLKLASQDQFLFIEANLDLSASGALVQVIGSVQNARELNGEVLVSVAFQILASVQDRSAHVTAVLDLAKAAEDGRIRVALPLARRLFIPQLSPAELVVHKGRITEVGAQTQLSALWVPLVVGVFMFVVPLGTAIYWFKYAWPRLKPLWTQKARPRATTSAAAATSGEPHSLAVSGKMFGQGTTNLKMAPGSVEFSSRRAPH
jgi:hypothetical protein